MEPSLKEDFLFAMWNLQPISRLMVSFQMAEKHHWFNALFTVIYTSSICVLHGAGVALFDIRTEFVAHNLKKRSFKVEVNTDHQEEASGWWVELEFVAKKSLLFWVKSDCVSASTDPPLHANAICAIFSKTKKLWDSGKSVFNSVLP